MYDILFPTTNQRLVVGNERIVKMNDWIYRLISKKKEISRHITKVEFDIGLFIVSIWLVEKDGHFFMIDTGMKKMVTYLLKMYFPDIEIEGVFLTHGHSDHVGGVARLLELHPRMPIYIDNRELPYLLKEKPYPRRKNLEKVKFDAGLLRNLQDEGAQETLARAGLTPLWTPGHSPGHTCYFHEEDKVLIAGDLLTTNRRGALRPPMKAYTADMSEALTTAQNLLQAYPQALLSVCHGGEVRNALDELEKADWYKNKET